MRGSRSQIANEIPENGAGRLERDSVFCRKGRDSMSERLDAARARSKKQALSLHRCGEMDSAAVVGAGAFPDQAFRFQGMHDAGHGGRADLFRVGQPAERDWPRENDDREGREAGRVEAAAGIGAPQFAQQMDGD